MVMFILETYHVWAFARLLGYQKKYDVVPNLKEVEYSEETEIYSSICQMLYMYAYRYMHV